MRSSSKSAGGQVANRPIYAAIGVSLDGHRDVLGLWAGPGGEGANFFDERADRHPTSRHPGRILPGLRRAQRPTGRSITTRVTVDPGSANSHTSRSGARTC
ncbi:hypothetical protein BS618_31790 [Rhodococcus erythropolis]|nr:hypothetical protein BS618_31790 [Rhodococcus erythropolis]